MSFADSIKSQHKNDHHVIEKDKCWAFDIETLGKLPFVISSTSFTGSKTTKTAIIPSITCACLYNGTIEHSLCFYGVPQTIIDSNLVLLLEILDTAQVLIGFNAIHFDLEYIQRFFKLPITKLNHWISKTVDPYLFMKTNLGITCSLSTILAMNHLPSKSASGLKAIIWAKQGRMDLVLDYCMMDTKLTYTLCFGNNGSFRINDLWLVNWIYNPTHISTFKTTKKFKFQKKKLKNKKKKQTIKTKVLLLGLLNVKLYHHNLLFILILIHKKKNKKKKILFLLHKIKDLQTILFQLNALLHKALLQQFYLLIVYKVVISVCLFN